MNDYSVPKSKINRINHTKKYLVLYTNDDFPIKFEFCEKRDIPYKIYVSNKLNMTIKVCEFDSTNFIFFNGIEDVRDDVTKLLNRFDRDQKKLSDKLFSPPRFNK